MFVSPEEKAPERPEKAVPVEKPDDKPEKPEKAVGRIPSFGFE